jgi:hypothetical protein
MRTVVKHENAFAAYYSRRPGRQAASYTVGGDVPGLLYTLRRPLVRVAGPALRAATRPMLARVREAGWRRIRQMRELKAGGMFLRILSGGPMKEKGHRQLFYVSAFLRSPSGLRLVHARRVVFVAASCGRMQSRT